MEETKTRQLTLLPEELPNVDERRLDLDRLPADKELLAPPVTPDLVEGIWALGQLQPLVLLGITERGRDHWVPEEVRAGRRRIAALRVCRARWSEHNATLGDRALPEHLNPYAAARAYVVTGKNAPYLAQLIDIWLNSSSHENMPAERHAVEELLEAGHGEVDVRRKLKLPASRLGRLLKLRRLLPELRGAWEEGRMDTSVAEAASSLPEAAQRRLLEEYLQGGAPKVTGAMVKAQRQAMNQATAQSLQLPEMPGLEAMGVAPPAPATAAAPDPDAVAAGEALRERAAQARTVKVRQAPKWTRVDCDNLDTILAALGVAPTKEEEA